MVRPGCSAQAPAPAARRCPPRPVAAVVVVGLHGRPAAAGLEGP